MKDPKYHKDMTGRELFVDDHIFIVNHFKGNVSLGFYKIIGFSRCGLKVKGMYSLPNDYIKTSNKQSMNNVFKVTKCKDTLLELIKKIEDDK
jgi:hypothetical protein